MDTRHFPHPRTIRFVDRASGRDPIQRILAIVDLGAVEQPALEKAARLAAAFGASLELCAFDEGENLPTSWAGGTTLAEYRSVVRERRLARLEELAAPYRESALDVHVTYEFRDSKTHPLVTHAIQSGASLVVGSAHPGSAFIAELPMPLLLVRARPWDAYPRVVMSIDPCHRGERSVDLDEAVLGLGSSISRALGGISSAVHVLEGPPHLPGEPVTESQRCETLEHQRAEVLDLVSRASLDDREVRFTDLRVPDGIVALASETHPAILVMGSAARQRQGTPEGGTAREIVERLDCDLLIVKPAGFVSPVMVSE